VGSADETGQGGGACTAAILLARARQLADELLAPAAERTDRSEIVPRAHLSALAEAGLFGLVAPRDAGGHDVDPPTLRAVLRTLGGGCGATSFVWAQHHGLVGLLRATDNVDLRSRWLPSLASGAMLAGTAFAHVRRAGPPVLRATRTGGGYRLDGEAPWVTSWGMADVYSVAAVTGDDQLVWSAVPAPDDPSEPEARLVPSPPLALAVMGATSTVRLRFDGLFVPDADVVSALRLALWRDRDRPRVACLNPSALGVADRSLALLASHDDDAAATARSALAEELRACEEVVEACAAAVDAGRGDIGSSSRARAWGLDLARRSADALAAASGGTAMQLDHPAQRLVREAAFYVVQAQDDAGRSATLQRLGAAGKRR
jgi:alkylation response protein AidB-like acyl-CoA dehydrogenase